LNNEPNINSGGYILCSSIYSIWIPSTLILKLT
jgi:hypothetical protein